MDKYPCGLRRDDENSFLEFVGAVLPHSFGQRFQDLWFLWETGFLTSGSFVEVGALNGRDFSNTYLLETIGWTGAVAEPHPDFEDKLKANRTCVISTKCVSSMSGQELTFRLVKGRPALSGLAEHTIRDSRSHLRENYSEIIVQTISLADLISDAGILGTIDCLSMDTEGSELEILSSWDFSRQPINCICVEHNNVSRHELYDLLTSNGYERKFEHISGHDDWYLLQGAYADWTFEHVYLGRELLLHLPHFEIALSERQNFYAELLADARDV